MSKTLKNILVGALFLLLLAMGYYMITQQDTFTLTLDGVSLVDGELLGKTQAFIVRRGKLDSIKLNTDMFIDPRFTSLRSYTTTIPEQSVGRANIFDVPAPVPVTRTISVE